MNVGDLAVWCPLPREVAQDFLALRGTTPKSVVVEIRSEPLFGIVPTGIHLTAICCEVEVIEWPDYPAKAMAQSLRRIHPLEALGAMVD